jgi:GT2 family glycosyltransferase
MNVDLSIVIVNWNVAPLLRDCLQAIYGAPGAGPAEGDTFALGPYTVEVWVVDSASSDDSVAMVRREFPQVQLLARLTTWAFSRGNNLALRRNAGAIPSC